MSVFAGLQSHSNIPFFPHLPSYILLTNDSELFPVSESHPFFFFQFNKLYRVSFYLPSPVLGTGMLGKGSQL